MPVEPVFVTARLHALARIDKRDVPEEIEA